MDIDIVNETSHFKYRVGGIIINDNKLLVVEIENNGFYCLPGGHVHMGETSTEAVVREVKEEVECDTEVLSILSIHENLFDRNNKHYHELGYYYLLKPISSINTSDYSRIENDNGVDKELKFKWLNISDLDKYDVRPALIINKIKNNDLEFTHIISKDK